MHRPAPWFRVLRLSRFFTRLPVSVKRARITGLAGQAALLSFFVLLSPAIAQAQTAPVIGNAQIVENRVSGELAGNRRLLAPASQVFRSDLIRTEAASSTQLLFLDRTDLRLGPAAQIRLDSAVFAGQSGTAVTLARGALRFVSGNGPVGSYHIRTPVATIGLRGTTVDVVLRQGRAFVTLVDGAAQVCVGNRCSQLVNRCEYVEAGGGQVQPARPLEASVPTFTSVCRGAACGGLRSCVASLGSGTGLPGPDPARGNAGGSGGAGGGGGGGNR